MLLYNTHDKAEGVIQEYYFHFFPLIVNYLVCCNAIKKHLLSLFGFKNITQIWNLAVIMSYKYLYYHIYPCIGCREIG